MAKLILFAIVITITSQLSQQKPVVEIEDTYADCKQGVNSRCFAMPEGCLDEQNCAVILYVKATESGADFVMYWNRFNNTQDRWVGAALSSDMKMGSDSVTECLISANNTVIVRQGLTHCSDKGCGVDTVEPVKGITNEKGSTTDNILTCSWSRTDDTMVKTLDFNIVTKKYYILLASGPTDKDVLRHHTHQWVSNEAVILGMQSKVQLNGIYADCKQGLNSICFGMPDDCVRQQNCDVLLKVKPTESGADFVLNWNRGNDTQDRWVGAGLSDDNKMGGDSVTECLISENNMVIVRQGLTHCTQYGCIVHTIEQVKGITSEKGSLIDNVLTCSWSRTDDTMVNALKFNIVTINYYILLASGPTYDDIIQQHKDQWVSEKAVILGMQSKVQLKGIYADCKQGLNSICFGMPNNCVRQQNCDVLLKVKPTESGADFVLNWNRGNDTQDRWVGAGLSDDNKMGSDSVTECLISENNMVIVRQGLTSCYAGACAVTTVEPVKGITNEKGSFADDVLTCNWSRTDDTMVQGNEFNIVENKYYILLAHGPTDKDTLQHHTKQWVSQEAEYLGKHKSNATEV